MNKFKFLLSCLLVAVTCGEVSTLWCWKSHSCYCSFKRLVSISCRIVQDFSEIDGIFSRYPTVNKFQLTGHFSSMSSTVFHNVSIITLKLVIPLTDIAEDTFLGIDNLMNLELNYALYERIPAAVARTKIQMFLSTRGNLTSIHEELQNMTKLNTLMLRYNKITNVSPSAFHGTENLQTLDLSYNEISFLDPEIFRATKFLKDIDLKENKLSTVDGCFDLLNPRGINLYGNNLSSIDHAFHSSMWTMKSLDLGGNPHLRLSGSSFNASMKSLAELHLSNIGFSDIDPSWLKNFQSLFRLYLNGNNISSFSGNFFEYVPFLHELEVSDNRLQSLEGFMCSRGSSAKRQRNTLRVIKADGNQLTSIPRGEFFKSVTTLNLTRNMIHSIKENETSYLKKLSYFTISSNDLRSIDSGSFRTNRYLKSLDLSDNPLESLNGSLNNLPYLKSVYVRSSRLENLSEEDFQGSSRIKSLSFRNNSLKNVYKAFSSLKYISWLDISMNNLSTLTYDSFLTLPDGSIKLRSLFMEDNPWSCDCRLGWIVSWMKKKGSKLKDDPVCSSPLHLRGASIRSLNQTDFNQSLENCPTQCRCFCKSEGNIVFIVVECNRKGLTELPKVFPLNVLSLDVSFNELHSFDGQDVNELKELEILNLENNKITKVQLTGLPSQILNISLANNRLRSFPMDEVGHIKSLTLSGNPWGCDCNAWEFRNWLIARNDLISDLHEVRCGEDENIFLRHKPIVTLTRRDLCSVLSLFVVIIIAVSGCIIFALCLCCYWYRHTLAAILYSWGVDCVKRDSHDMPYDVFMLYSDSDEQLAGQIAAGLENNKRRYMLCIPNRDIISPRTPERVTAFMLQCCKIVVIVTRKFLENEGCMHLFRSCMSFSLDSSTKNILLIKVGEIPPAPQMDATMLTVMKTCVCLQWKQRLFWQKLVYNLPRRHNAYEWDADDEPLLEQHGRS